MKVLSIDIDYIMRPSIDLYQGEYWNDCAHWRWKTFFENSEVLENNLDIDKINLLFCYDVFLKSIKESSCKVSFSYDHDNILFDIGEFKDIELINIDHHHDILYPVGDDDESVVKSFKEKYEQISKYSMVDEGNWVGWLRSKDKIKSYTWIGNENSFSSISDFKLMYFKNFLPKFTMKTRENYTFKDYKFDHIFICLSPQYIPPIHWHYFNMFKMAYEQISGNSVNIIESTTKKFETFMRHSAVTDEILY